MMNTQGNSLLLVNPPAVITNGKGSRGYSYLESMVGNSPRSSYFSIPIEHLGLLSIKSYAQLQGIEIQIVNGIVERHNSTEQTLGRIKEVVKSCGEPLLIGFSQIIAFEQSVWLASECKKMWPGVTTIFGHDFASLNWRKILRDYRSTVDFVAVGEGEKIYTEVSIRLLNNQDVTDIPGLAYYCNESQRSLMPISPMAMNLDELPWVCRDELPFVKKLGFSAGVVASRGCPYRCSYCTTGQVSRVIGRGGYRQRSIENIAEEMRYLWRYEKCDFINICDDLFITPSNQSKLRAIAFAEELTRCGYKGHFMIDARVDSLDKEVFKQLYNAGLRRVFVGIESGNLDTLKQFDKKYILRGKSINQRISEIKDIGIDVIPGIIAFHPTIEPYELRETLEVMRETGFHAPHMVTSPIMVFPGTTLHKRYAEKNYLYEDWPMGLWKFSNKRAEQAYFELKRLVAISSGANFDEFLQHANLILDDWEQDVAINHTNHQSTLM